MRDYAYAKDDSIKEDGSNQSAVLYKMAYAEQGIAPLLEFIRSLPEQEIPCVGTNKDEAHIGRCPMNVEAGG